MEPLGHSEVMEAGCLDMGVEEENCVSLKHYGKPKKNF